MDADQTSLTRDSPYSYACGACSRCCRHYLIRVNPYEVLRLARHLGLSSSEFLAQYVGADSALTHKSDDTCVFLGPQGCGVHPARPLVCRLYPLGRHLTGEDVEHFFRMEPHPETEGIYGEDGTVGDYLRSQGAQPFMAAADRYMVVFRKMFQALAAAEKADLPAGSAATAVVPELLDAEKAIAMMFPGRSIAGTDVDQTMALHLEALEMWLMQLHPKES